MNLKSSKEYEPCFLLLPQLSQQTRVETLAMQTTTLPNNSFARAAHFFVHIFIVTTSPRRENVFFSRFMEDMIKRRSNFPSLYGVDAKFSFSLWPLGMFLRNSTPVDFAYI